MHKQRNRKKNGSSTQRVRVDTCCTACVRACVRRVGVVTGKYVVLPEMCFGFCRLGTKNTSILRRGLSLWGSARHANYVHSNVTKSGPVQNQSVVFSRFTLSPYCDEKSQKRPCRTRRNKYIVQCRKSCTKQKSQTLLSYTAANGKLNGSQEFIEHKLKSEITNCGYIFLTVVLIHVKGRKP